jgi:hypothetical protein
LPDAEGRLANKVTLRNLAIACIACINCENIVRAHFRRLPNGKLTWVRAHQRGLAYELYVPSVRKVE